MFRPTDFGVRAGFGAAALAALVIAAPTASTAAPAAPTYVPELTSPVETVAARKKVRKRPVVRYYRNGAPIAAAIGALAIGAAAAAASGAFVDDDDYYYRPYPRRYYGYEPYYGAAPVYGYGYRQRYYQPRYAAPQYRGQYRAAPSYRGGYVGGGGPVGGSVPRGYVPPLPSAGQNDRGTR